MTKSRVRVSLTESGDVVFVCNGGSDEPRIVVLSEQEAEEVLFDLHSIVMTKRGVAKPANGSFWERFMRRFQ